MNNIDEMILMRLNGYSWNNIAKRYNERTGEVKQAIIAVITKEGF